MTKSKTKKIKKGGYIVMFYYIDGKNAFAGLGMGGVK
jgi:hypothetical protein